MPDRVLDVLEQERRASLLKAIEHRISVDGEHIAKPGPDRARQFMPFAALRGYEELVDERAQDLLREQRHELTDEEREAFSHVVGSLSKGDTVCITVFDDDSGRERKVEGTVSEVVSALQRMRIGEEWIRFADVVNLRAGTAGDSK